MHTRSHRYAVALIAAFAALLASPTIAGAVSWENAVKACAGNAAPFMHSWMQSMSTPSRPTGPYTWQTPDSRSYDLGGGRRKVHIAWWNGYYAFSRPAQHRIDQICSVDNNYNVYRQTWPYAGAAFYSDIPPHWWNQ